MAREESDSSEIKIKIAGRTLLTKQLTVWGKGPTETESLNFLNGYLGKIQFSTLLSGSHILEGFGDVGPCFVSPLTKK
jgi:hypothetical protein